MPWGPSCSILPAGMESNSVTSSPAGSARLRSGRPGRSRSHSERAAARAAARAARRAAMPPITYPAELPVSQRKDDIAAVIRDHQVVIVAGETGSGKTTQIPKICLELGRGVTGMIGHTQPRRLAARTVADRIAEELGSPEPSDRSGGRDSTGGPAPVVGYKM